MEGTNISFTNVSLFSAGLFVGAGLRLGFLAVDIFEDMLDALVERGTPR
jgi:hypothetical protein